MLAYYESVWNIINNSHANINCVYEQSHVLLSTKKNVLFFDTQRNKLTWRVISHPLAPFYKSGYLDAQTHF